MDGARKDPGFQGKALEDSKQRIENSGGKGMEALQVWLDLVSLVSLANLVGPWNAWNAPDVQKTPRTFFHREKRSQFQKHVQLTGIPVKVRSLSFEAKIG